MNNNITDTVLMVPPHDFSFNEQTALSNKYQQNANISDLSKVVMSEFDGFVDILLQHHINTLVFEHTYHDAVPDAVFPNNWFSTHYIDSQRYLIIYPMLTENRRHEVVVDSLVSFLSQHNILVDQIHDLRSDYQAILEGTGSLVFDHAHRLIYAALSPRTDASLVSKVSRILSYGYHFIETFDKEVPVYHTNVMLSLSPTLAVVCPDVIAEHSARDSLIKQLSDTHCVLEINQGQMHAMAANCLLLQNQKAEPYLILSQQALDSLAPQQIKLLEAQATLLPVCISTIEKIGGGSARCMLAEIY